MIFENSQLKLAYDFVQFTNRSIFLTGKAGTGKTTFLHQLKKISPKRMAVVAPTGVAAINAGGVTIHSFFQMSFGPQIPDGILSNKGNTISHLKPSPAAKRFNKEKIKLIQSLDLLVIDEISMVRSDMLDAIDEVLRKYKNRSKPFGGVQLLMIGDLHQLSPVVKDDEWILLRDYYDTFYFFGSRALQKAGFVTIELTHIFRQTDKYFIDLLSKVRTKAVNNEVLEEINKRYIPGFKPKDEEGYIILTTHNSNAAEINNKKLSENKNTSFFAKARIDGDFPPYIFPTETNLELKKGAQVMFVKNDSSREKLYYNGKIGKITLIEEDIVYVKCPGDLAEIPVNIVDWQNVKYSLDESTKEVKENVIGTFMQYPLKLAWAITIHKSQGLTFEKAIIDAQASFAFGQVYVALSRCRTLEGLVLSSPITINGIKTDDTITEFTKKSHEEEPNESELEASKILFQQTLLLELFDFTGLKKLFYSLGRALDENKNILDPVMISEVYQIENEFIGKIYSVADRFKIQLNQLFAQNEAPEENENIQERIKKAATYFSEIIESLLIPFFESYILETDNKAVRVQVLEYISKLQLVAFVKKSILKNCIDGFKTLELLKVQANAEIDFNTIQKPKKSEKIKSTKNIPHSELYQELKAWRKTVAEENNAKAFMIMHQKHLMDLMDRMPRNFEELSMVKGFGQKRIQHYGSDILSIINEYCNDQGIEAEQTEILEPEIKIKKAKVNSKKLSFEMFNSGKTIAEIAAERGFSPLTIEGHLAHYVSLGELEVEQFVDSEKIKKISDFFVDHNTSSLTAAKEFFGDNVSYSDLKFVLNSLRKNQVNPE